ncbi:MAG: C39 family peptidase [Planctomycetota bacterium]
MSTPAANVDTTAAAHADPAAWLSNPLGMVDSIFVVETEAGWREGAFEQTKLDDAGRLVLDVPEKAYPARGRWTSPVVRASEQGVPAFTEFVPSFNVDAPRDTGVRVSLRVWRGAGDTIPDEDELQTRGGSDGVWLSGWSPWLDLDGWGETRGTGRDAATTFAGGNVAVDWIELNADAPANAYQLRVELVSFDTTHQPHGISPAVRLLQVTASSPIDVGALANHPSRAAIDPASVRPIDHDVPYFRQAANGPALGPRTCSPTCTSMVLNYFGHPVDPRLVSEAIYDRRYFLFGNWPRAAAYASTYGHRATIERFRTWRDLERTLHAGSPVIASIRFEEGEFPSNRMKRTSGHLIVIRGLDDNGDAIVNDPAFDDGSGERVILKADEFARAWLGTGGVGYVIQPVADTPPAPLANR